MFNIRSHADHWGLVLFVVRYRVHLRDARRVLVTFRLGWCQLNESILDTRSKLRRSIHFIDPQYIRVGGYYDARYSECLL